MNENESVNLKEVQEKIRQSINWVAIGILCIVMMLISLFRVDGAGISMRDFPTNWQGWLLWGIMVLAVPLITVMMFLAFKQEGIKQGHTIPEVKEARDEWLRLVSKDKTVNPRSQKEYLATTTTKEAVPKFITSALLSFAVMSIAMAVDLSCLVGLVLQLFMALGFGLIKMFQAMEYCSEELVVWYKREIERINNEIEIEKKEKIKNDTIKIQEVNENGKMV